MDTNEPSATFRDGLICKIFYDALNRRTPGWRGDQSVGPFVLNPRLALSPSPGRRRRRQTKATIGRKEEEEESRIWKKKNRVHLWFQERGETQPVVVFGPARER